MSELARNDELLRERMQRLAQAAVPQNTRRAYDLAWGRFRAWCAQRERVSLPASVETVCLWVTELAEGSVSRTRQSLAAISRAHGMQGLPSPCADARVRLLVHGHAREKGIASKPKRAIEVNDLRAMVPPAQGIESARIVRDRALLLLGFFAALRRSEIAALQWRDIEFVREGLLVHVRRSKGDQMGAGQIVAVPYQSELQLCAVRALETWRARAGEGAELDGPVFPRITTRITRRDLSGAGVAAIVKRHAKRAGIDAQEIGAHSLRSGFATSAAAAEKRPEAIQAQLRHKSLAMVSRYVHRKNVWRNNAAAGLGA